MKKIGSIAVIGLMMFFLVPFGESAETKYLGNCGDFVGVSLDVIEGDVVRGDYRTYNSPFLVGVGWGYLGVDDTFTSYYESGWFEISISSGSGIIDIVLANVDLYDGGYIEYTITNPKGEARKEEQLMTTIIIGVVVGIISICVIAGLVVHFKNEDREIIRVSPAQRKIVQKDKELAPKVIFDLAKMSFIKTEYESNKSIQDIANGLGMSMISVKKYLDEIEKTKI